MMKTTCVDRRIGGLENKSKFRIMAVIVDRRIGGLETIILFIDKAGNR